MNTKTIHRLVQPHLNCQAAKRNIDQCNAILNKPFNGWSKYRLKYNTDLAWDTTKRLMVNLQIRKRTLYLLN